MKMEDSTKRESSDVFHNNENNNNNKEEELSEEKYEQNKKSLIIILLAVFIDLFGVGLVYPLIPFYATQLGASQAEIGAIGSFYGILQLFGSFFVGKMSDKYGRKAVFVISLISAGLSYYCLSIATSVFFLFMARVPIGIFKQTVTIATTIIADKTTFNDRAKYLGFLGTAVGMGFIFGPTISAMLVEWMGIYYPVYLCSFLYLFDVFMFYSFFPNDDDDEYAHHISVVRTINDDDDNDEHEDDNERISVRSTTNDGDLEIAINSIKTNSVPLRSSSSSSPSLSSSSSFGSSVKSSSTPTLAPESSVSVTEYDQLRVDDDQERVFSDELEDHSLIGTSLLNKPKLIINRLMTSAIAYMLFIQFIATLAELTFNSTYQQFAYVKYNLSASENGYLMSYMSLLEVIVQGVVVGPLTKYKSEGELITMSIILYSLSTFILGMISTIPIALFVLIPTLGSFRIFSTCLTSCISKSAPKKELGSIFGIAGSLGSFCRAISPYIGGLIVQYFGNFTGTLVVSLIAFSLFFSLTFKPIY